MQFDQYVVARRTRLVEHAVALGEPADTAAVLVERVLAEQRQAIERAEDPDPAVREAVAAAVRGEDVRESRRSGRLALLALVLLGAVVAALAVRQLDRAPAPVPVVPTTFTLEARAAEALLRDAGYEVETRPVVVCENAGQVVSTEPPPGSEAPTGSTVVLQVARPPGLSCPGGVGFRAMVWEVLRWVGGLGPPPPLAERTTVVTVDAGGSTTVRLDRDELVRAVADGEVLEPLRRAVTEVAATDTGFPELALRSPAAPPPCETDQPDGNDGLLAIRFDLSPTPGSTDSCLLTGYLLPEAGAVATILLVGPFSS